MSGSTLVAGAIGEVGRHKRWIIRREWWEGGRGGGITNPGVYDPEMAGVMAVQTTVAATPPLRYLGRDPAAVGLGGGGVATGGLGGGGVAKMLSGPPPPAADSGGGSYCYGLGAYSSRVPVPSPTAQVGSRVLFVLNCTPPPASPALTRTSATPVHPCLHRAHSLER